MKKLANLETTITKEINEGIIIKEAIVGCTESRARLIYAKIKENIVLGDKIKTFCGLFFTCLITIFTADFKDVFGLKESGKIVMTSFILLTAYSLIISIFSYIKWRKIKEKYNEDGFIKLIKNNGRNL